MASAVIATDTGLAPDVTVSERVLLCRFRNVEKLAAVRERDPGVTSSRLLLRPEPPNERPFPLFDPSSRYRNRMRTNRSKLLCITSVAFRSDVLHPEIKVVSFICVLDKEVLKSVLPVCRGERLFTDSAMEQATWKS